MTDQLLDRQVVTFVLADFSPITPGTVRLGAMVAVPKLPIISGTCGHRLPAIPELVAYRRAALDGKCECGAVWAPIDPTCNAPLLRINHPANCATERALESWIRGHGGEGMGVLVWELVAPGAGEGS